VLKTLWLSYPLISYLTKVLALNREGTTPKLYLDLLILFILSFSFLTLMLEKMFHSL